MDAREVVDEIRSFLQSDDWRFDERLRELAQAYAELCREANRRLRQCEQLLQRQLKSEAVQLAEVEPKVLDLVAVLDFPERAEWDDVVVTYELPQAERLLTSVADELNRAYNDQLPLEQLLEKHRLLALARAPLAWRLAILRRLAQADPESFFWEDDIRDMERARLNQMQKQLAQASERLDTATVEEIVSELRKEEWLLPEARKFLATARRELKKVQRLAARRELDGLAQQLNDAFAALDLPAARQLEQRWNELARVAELTPGEELHELVAPALAWLADQRQIEQQEKQYQQLLAQMESLLDADEPDARQLERLASGVEKLGRELPSSLARRYENRLRAARLAERRRQILLVGAALLGVVLVVALVTVVLRRRIHARQVADAVQQVQQMLDQGELEEARQFVDAHGDFASSPQWQEVVRKLKQAEEKEKARRLQLESLAAQIEQAGDFEQAKELLEQARQVAKTTEEKLRLAELEQTWAEKEAEARARQVREFQDRLDRTTQLLSQLDQAAGTADERRIERLLAEAEAGVTALEQAAAGLGATATSQAAAARSRLREAKGRVERLRKERELLQTLGAGLPVEASAPTTGDILNHHVDTLKRFVSELPESPRAVDFKRALSQEKAWRAVVEWAQLCGRWSSLVPDEVGGQEAAARANACRELLKKFPESPDAEVIERCEQFFTAVARRGGGDESGINLRQDWLDLLSDPVLSEAYCLETLDGESWYLPRPADFGGRPAAIVEYFADYGNRTDQRSFRKDELRGIEAREAPHVLLLRGPADRIKTLPLPLWDKWHLELAESLLAAADVDPLLRYVLLVRVLEAAADGNPFLKTELAELRQRLHDDQIDLSARWMDPEDRDAKAMRRTAERLLRRVKSDALKQCWLRAEQALKAFEAQLHQPLLLAGVALRAGGGSWQLRASRTSQRSGVLLVLAARGEAGTAWKRVGEVTEGAPTWSAQADAVLCEGALVFQTRRSEDAAGRAGLGRGGPFASTW